MGTFNGNEMAAKHMVAKLASDMEQKQQIADTKRMKKVHVYQASPQYYIASNGYWIGTVLASTLLFSLLLLWFCVCLQSEEKGRMKALEKLSKYGSDPEALKDEYIMRAVKDAEAALESNLLFRALCRMVTDSFLITGASAYETEFRKALLDALKQDMFMCGLILIFAACFCATLYSFVSLACNRRMWVQTQKKQD